MGPNNKRGQPVPPAFCRETLPSGELEDARATDSGVQKTELRLGVPRSPGLKPQREQGPGSPCGLAKKPSTVWVLIAPEETV